MDNKIITIIPSLLDMAMIKIATSLWNESNILHDIFSELDLNLISDRVKENIQSLDLPLSFRRRIDSLTCVIREQICSWLLPHYDSYYSRPNCVHLFFWTAQGTLDQKSTAMRLLRNEEINVFDRFRMACFWCLESEIYSLWHRIDKNSLNPSQIQLLFSNEFERFWTLQMDPNIGELYEIHPGSISFMRIMREAVMEANFPAVKYFFPKLTTIEKNNFLSGFPSIAFVGIGVGSESPYVDIVHFVFSSVDQDYQNKLLKECCYKILSKFLNWPWLNHFLEYSKLCWNYLSLQQFLWLLRTILIIRAVTERQNYDALFAEFWMQSPISFRRFMVKNNYIELFSFLDENDEHKISLFLEHTSVEERKIIIFSDYGMRICRFILTSKWWLLSSRFLAECLSTAEMVVNFRKKIEGLLLDYVENDKREVLKGAAEIFDTLLKKRSDEENGGS